MSGVDSELLALSQGLIHHDRDRRRQIQAAHMGWRIGTVSALPVGVDKSRGNPRVSLPKTNQSPGWYAIEV